MPLYEYECDACGQRFEIIQKFSDPPASTCTKCGKGPVQRLLSSPAIQFKGTGWYITDYSKKGKDGKSAEKSETKSDAKAGTTAETKTETKSEAKTSSGGS
jgi:putative FmdB family regulatory protein